MHRSKNSFLEWLVYSLIFFFLYDIIWLLVDLPDFLQSVNGLYPELLVDFTTSCAKAHPFRGGMIAAATFSGTL